MSGHVPNIKLCQIMQLRLRNAVYAVQATTQINHPTKIDSCPSLRLSRRHQTSIDLYDVDRARTNFESSKREFDVVVDFVRSEMTVLLEHPKGAITSEFDDFKKFSWISIRF